MANRQINKLNKLLVSIEKTFKDLDNRFIEIFEKIGGLCNTLSQEGNFVQKEFGTRSVELEEEQKILLDNCATKCERRAREWKGYKSIDKKGSLEDIVTAIDNFNISCFYPVIGKTFKDTINVLQRLSEIYK